MGFAARILACKFLILGFWSGKLGILGKRGKPGRLGGGHTGTRLAENNQEPFDGLLFAVKPVKRGQRTGNTLPNVFVIEIG
jgi:hypothetical protein